MKRFIIVIWVLWWPMQTLVGQEIVLSEAWLSYGVTHKINKKWKLYAEGQWRLNSNDQIPQPFLLEVAGRRRVSKVFSIKMQYRYTWINGFRNTQRLALDGRFKWKTANKKWVFNYRTRIQVKRVNYNGQILSSWRNRIGVARNITEDVNVYVNLENFVQTLKMNSFLRVDSPKFNKNRYTLGAKYAWGKNTLNAFYRLEQDVDCPEFMIQIFGLGVSHKW